MNINESKFSAAPPGGQYSIGANTLSRSEVPLDIWTVP